MIRSESNFETNTEEYEPEVGTILPRLNEANGAEDLSHIIHEEFPRWFGDEEMVGTPAKYAQIAIEIWEAYQ